MSTGGNRYDNARRKYFRDRESLMRFFGVAPMRWALFRRGGGYVAIEKHTNREIWGKTIREMIDLFRLMGVKLNEVEDMTKGTIQ